MSNSLLNFETLLSQIMYTVEFVIIFGLLFVYGWYFKRYMISDTKFDTFVLASLLASLAYVSSLICISNMGNGVMCYHYIFGMY